MMSVPAEEQKIQIIHDYSNKNLMIMVLGEREKKGREKEAKKT
jgi:hypothetical protein